MYSTFSTAEILQKFRNKLRHLYTDIHTDHDEHGGIIASFFYAPEIGLSFEQRWFLNSQKFEEFLVKREILFRKFTDVLTPN